MAYASQTGRARTNPSDPNAHAICDRCGFRYNWIDLNWQNEWRGASLMNIRILVCRRCLDTPQEQLRAIVVPADPLPIINARVQDFAIAETNYQTITQLPVYDPTTGIPIPGTTTLVTQDGRNLATQETGPPTGLTQSAIMPLQGNVHYGVCLNLLSVTANGTTIITVTCSSPHGLSTNGQIAAEGLSNNKADGFYSVTVLGAMSFTYMTNTVIPSGSLLTATALITTASVGLPLQFDQIPQTGI